MSRIGTTRLVALLFVGLLNWAYMWANGLPIWPVRVSIRVHQNAQQGGTLQSSPTLLQFLFCLCAVPRRDELLRRYVPFPSIFFRPSSSSLVLHPSLNSPLPVYLLSVLPLCYSSCLLVLRPERLYSCCVSL
jgi:hypothetical protein